MVVCDVLANLHFIRHLCNHIPERFLLNPDVAHIDLVAENIADGISLPLIAP